MDRLKCVPRRWLSGLLLVLGLPTFASTRTDVVKADLPALIRAAASAPTQFAVAVPHAVSSASDGMWSTTEQTATWHYTVRIPTAISLSFHADRVLLPASALITVRGASSTFIYRASDLHDGALWSRIQPGDTLELTLSVAASERSLTVLHLVSLQAGYRSLGGRVADHPVYTRMKALSSTSSAACAQNYQCKVTAANTAPAAATVGVVVGNLYQCTGTLLNDVPGDNTAYLLTARHCQSGKLGGGNPGAAANVTVYWNAVSACGTTLGTLYDSGIVTQTGATTIVEQQDAWLLRLDASPVFSDAQLAGFDASGGAIQGGYTIQHSLGNDKQLTQWTGQALATQQSSVLGTTYASDFWEVVNIAGNIGPGASGSGLINQNNRLVGSLSLGRQSSDGSGYESCPASPSPPNGSNGAADFTSLAAVWNSTADTSSSTGSRTLSSVLDPAHTGALTTSSRPAATMTFMATSYSLAVGDSVQLNWNAPGATQCVAGGGAGGDGWSGALSGSGARSISESVDSVVQYTIDCTLPGNRGVKASVSITWGSPTPYVDFRVQFAAWTNAQARLSWTSSVAPCSINGGGLSLSNLPSSGSTTATQTTPGEASYEIQCGSEATVTSMRGSVQFVTPSVVFNANGTDRLLGQPLHLSWQSFADTCTPSGGAPNDGWTSTAFPNPGVYPSFDTVIAATGSFNYILTCSSGDTSITKTIQVKVENGAPFATLSLDRTSYTFTNSSSDGFLLSWNSNLSICYPGSDPLMGGFISNFNPQDTGKFAPPPGTYSLFVTCNPDGTNVGQVVSAYVTATVLPPPPPTVTIKIDPPTVPQGQTFTVTWDSTNTLNCVGTGGLPDQSWVPQLTSSYSPYVPTRQGKFTFGISCQSIDSAQANATAEATVTVTAPLPPTAALSSSSATVTQGQNFTLTWSSTNADSCTAGGGESGTGWSGTLATTSGSASETASTVGSFTYTVTCTGEGQTAQAQTIVAVQAAASSGQGNGQGGGHGGGGTFDQVLLGLLAGLVLVQRRRECLLF